MVGREAHRKEKIVNKAVRTLRATAVATVAAALVFSVGGLVVARNADAAVTSWAAVSTVNVRSGPGTSYSILGVLQPGNTVAAVGTATSGWVTVTYNGQKGYVYSSYLRAATSTTDAPAAAPTTAGTKVTTAQLNVRAGASLTAQIITTLDAGTTVNVTGRTSGDWTEVSYQGTARWMYTAYLGNPATAVALSAKVASQGKTTASLNQRASASVSAALVGSLPAGTLVSLTGKTDNGYSEIIANGGTAWILSAYIGAISATAGVTSGALPPATATMYILGMDVNVRSGSSSTADIVTTLDSGTAIGVTGTVENGRTQVIWDNALRWVASQYLTSTKPAVGTTLVSTSPVAGNTPGSQIPFANVTWTGGSLGSTNLDKTTQWSKNLVVTVKKLWPQISTMYGWRSSDAYSSDHPSGLAIDVMIPNYRSNVELGTQIRDYFQANASKYHVRYIIYRQHIWTVASAAKGWRYMADRGGDTANHMDHVHISVYAN